MNEEDSDMQDLKKRVNEVHEYVLGNGKPEEGLAFRFNDLCKDVAFIKKALIGLIGIIATAGGGWGTVAGLSSLFGGSSVVPQ